MASFSRSFSSEAYANFRLFIWRARQFCHVLRLGHFDSGARRADNLHIIFQMEFIVVSHVSAEWAIFTFYRFSILAEATFTATAVSTGWHRNGSLWNAPICLKWFEMMGIPVECGNLDSWRPDPPFGYSNSEILIEISILPNGILSTNFTWPPQNERKKKSSKRNWTRITTSAMLHVGRFAPYRPVGVFCANGRFGDGFSDWRRGCSPLTKCGPNKAVLGLVGPMTMD